jgi:hypothetical protein
MPVIAGKKKVAGVPCGVSAGYYQPKPRSVVGRTNKNLLRSLTARTTPEQAQMLHDLEQADLTPRTLQEIISQHKLPTKPLRRRKAPVPAPPPMPVPKAPPMPVPKAPPMPVPKAPPMPVPKAPPMPKKRVKPAQVALPAPDAEEEAFLKAPIRRPKGPARRRPSKVVPVPKTKVTLKEPAPKSFAQLKLTRQDLIKSVGQFPRTNRFKEFLENFPKSKEIITSKNSAKKYSMVMDQGFLSVEGEEDLWRAIRDHNAPEERIFDEGL